MQCCSQAASKCEEMSLAMIDGPIQLSFLVIQGTYHVSE